MFKRSLCCILCTVLVERATFAQSESPLPQPADAMNVPPVQVIGAAPAAPATKLAAFADRAGVVIVKRHANLAVIQADDASSIRLTALEFSADEGTEKLYGLSVGIHDVGRSERRAFVYVDYDQISPLLAALEAFEKIASSAQFPEFAAVYRTSGGLEVTTVNNDGERFAGGAMHRRPGTGPASHRRPRVAAHGPDQRDQAAASERLAGARSRQSRWDAEITHSQLAGC